MDPLRQRVVDIDDQLSDLRRKAVADMKEQFPVDTLVADRICDELLPQYDELEHALREREELSIDLDFEQFLQMRRQSWERLAEAIRNPEASYDLLEEHLQLWESTELLLVRRMADSWETPTREAGARLLKQFEDELEVFTCTAWGTPALVMVNFAAFVTMAVMGIHVFTPNAEDLLHWGANYGPETLNGQWWRTVTSMFIHIGAMHIIFNMWVLLGLGRLMERLVGTSGFLLLYFASGIAGSLCSVAWDGAVVSAGASGAIFGVGGALVGLISRSHGMIPDPVVAHLRGSIGAFLTYNLSICLRH